MKKNKIVILFTFFVVIIYERYNRRVNHRKEKREK